MADGRYAELRGLFDDRVHQPYRRPLLPALAKVIRAGEKAGALGGFLSGSGSGIVCLTLEKAAAVARAMQSALRRSAVKILRVDNQGLQISVTR